MAHQVLGETHPHTHTVPRCCPQNTEPRPHPRPYAKCRLQSLPTHHRAAPPPAALPSHGSRRVGAWRTTACNSPLWHHRMGRGRASTSTRARVDPQVERGRRRGRRDVGRGFTHLPDGRCVLYRQAVALVVLLAPVVDGAGRHGSRLHRDAAQRAAAGVACVLRAAESTPPWRRAPPSSSPPRPILADPVRRSRRRPQPRDGACRRGACGLHTGRVVVPSPPETRTQLCAPTVKRPRPRVTTMGCRFAS